MMNLVTIISNPPKHELVLMRERTCLARGTRSPEVWIKSTQEEYDRIKGLTSVKLDMIPYHVANDIWILGIELHNIYNTRENNREFVIYADHIIITVQNGDNVTHMTEAIL